jgi:hypothetical protein
MNRASRLVHRTTRTPADSRYELAVLVAIAPEQSPRVTCRAPQRRVSDLQLPSFQSRGSLAPEPRVLRLRKSAPEGFAARRPSTRVQLHGPPALCRERRESQPPRIPAAHRDPRAPRAPGRETSQPLSNGAPFEVVTNRSSSRWGRRGTENRAAERPAFFERSARSPRRTRRARFLVRSPCETHQGLA